jgi:hypothetical protein
LICPICTQWNPGDAAQCVFCQNDLARGEDQTIQGKAGYTVSGPISILKVAPGDAPPTTSSVEWGIRVPRVVWKVAWVAFCLILFWLLHWVGC